VRRLRRFKAESKAESERLSSRTRVEPSETRVIPESKPIRSDSLFESAFTKNESSRNRLLKKPIHSRFDPIEPSALGERKRCLRT
jgi:hypothetical protein